MTRAPLRAWLALAICAGVGVSLVAGPAQDPAPQTPQQRFRSGADTVYVPVTVTDIGGRFVRTLDKEDFTILDNGRPQEITIFDREYQTISAIVMLDASASMLSSFDRVLSAANDFVVRLMPGDQARIGSFSEEVQISPDFTGDRDVLLKIFANEFNVRIGRRTRLWDAMYQAVETLAHVDGRRVVIVVTDGVDSWSIKTFDDVAGAARRHNVAMFAVRVNHDDRRGQAIEFSRGPDGSAPGRRSPQPGGGFESLARDTGGGFVSIDAKWAHQAPFTDIMLDLHSAYTLGFTPTALDGKVHSLTVRVRGRDLEVKARRSYLAEPAGAGTNGGVR
jgi:Ca-activated chloride channel family protein